jgi:septal ring factor EnvC (AmiA/AmiB activator)
MENPTTLNQSGEMPVDYQIAFAEKLEELKHINQNIARNREEIDFLEAETRKRLDKIKRLFEEK